MQYALIKFFDGVFCMQFCMGTNTLIKGMIDKLNSELKGPISTICVIIGLIMCLVALVWLCKILLKKAGFSDANTNVSIVMAIVTLICGALFMFGGLWAAQTVSNGVIGEITEDI